ncbi:hypothetical protein E2562_005610, partial [Oryza meyeriana var. granulata]
MTVIDHDAAGRPRWEEEGITDGNTGSPAALDRGDGDDGKHRGNTVGHRGMITVERRDDGVGDCLAAA